MKSWSLLSFDLYRHIERIIPKICEGNKKDQWQTIVYTITPQNSTMVHDGKALEQIILVMFLCGWQLTDRDRFPSKKEQKKNILSGKKEANEKSNTLPVLHVKITGGKEDKKQRESHMTSNAHTNTHTPLQNNYQVICAGDLLSSKTWVRQVCLYLIAVRQQLSGGFLFTADSVSNPSIQPPIHPSHLSIHPPGTTSVSDPCICANSSPSAR